MTSNDINNPLVTNQIHPHQQLCRVIVHVKWAYPKLFETLIPRLGGMHMLMSFVGCVGTRMADTGLKEVMESAFGGMTKLLSGKNFPQNVRALRLAVEELLHSISEQSESYDEMLSILEERARVSRTAKLWVNCLVQPVLIMMLFIRAEREAEWPLHLLVVKLMMPYFFAAGHLNYMRYGLYYLSSMQRLPDDILVQFMKGEHVMRHQAGMWNGMWSDIFIETTFMCYGHGPGGLVGITLNAAAMKRWALSLHTCSQLVKDLTDLKDGGHKIQITRHKEESAAQKASDDIDRQKIGEKLSLCTNPLDPDEHESGIVNIITWKVCVHSVNVDCAVDIGREQIEAFHSSWPDGFHGTISTKVKTLTVSRKKITVGPGSMFDTSLIYTRVMGIAASRELDLKQVFQHELAPVPTSMFKDNGDMRITKTKSTLKNKLQVKQPVRTVCKQPASLPEVTIIDGCALLWVISWPSQGVVQDYIDNSIHY